MRQINVLAQALARAFSLRAEHRDGEALMSLDEAFRDLTGQDGGRPSRDHLLTISLDPEGGLQPFANDIAAMLTLRGDILAEQGELGPARNDYELALRIYRTALEEPSHGLQWDIHRRIDALEERLQDGGWLDG